MLSLVLRFGAVPLVDSAPTVLLRPIVRRRR